MVAIKKHLPLVIFCLYLLKTVLLPITALEVAILCILCVMACFFEFKNNEALIDELTTKASQDVQAVESKVQSIEQNLEAKVKDIENLKSIVASMKLANGMRQLGSK